MWRKGQACIVRRSGLENEEMKTRKSFSSGIILIFEENVEA